MKGFLRILLASMGGWFGWKIGMHVGLMTAYFASVFGTAAGVFAGRRLADNLRD